MEDGHGGADYLFLSLPLFVAEIGIVVIPIIPRRCDPTFRRFSSRYSPPKRAESWRETKSGRKRRVGEEGEGRQRSPEEDERGEGKKRVALHPGEVERAKDDTRRA